MRAKFWMAPLLLMGVALVGTWCTMRLMQGRPHWNSLFAVGAPQSRDHSAQMSAYWARQGARRPAAAGSGQTCPAGGSMAEPGTPPAVSRPAPQGECPYTTKGDSASRSGAPAPDHLPTDRPPAGSLPAADPPSGSSSAVCPVAGKPAGAGDPTTTLKDPVCGMTVTPSKTAVTLKYNGTDYFFCSATCRDTFKKDPKRYAKR